MAHAPAPQGSLVDELVHQFTDPFAFYRELIQNSIDAGSTRIEVSLCYRPAAGGKGLALISVADWGEGMNRDVIENYLVTKFRSTKENDLTKIGKFGIGFVSIFACRPEAVTVETGRDGEFWRVLFRADTTWELLKLKEPLEGTRVTLHKTLTPSEYDDFVDKSRASLTRWCRHSDVDVVFTSGGADGSAPPPPAPVREPLVVDAPFQVEHKEDGTHIIAGPARRSPPSSGLYNRGLTLLETNEVLVEGVTLKIVSRYLEHTLTRDNVRRDRHFSRALGLAKTLVKKQLVPRLPDELRAAAERKDGADDWATLFTFALPRLKPAQLSFRLTGGGAASRAEVLAACSAGALPVAPERTPLVDRLLASKLPVLELVPGSALAHAALMHLELRTTALADEHYTYAAPPEAPTPPEFSAALTGLLSQAGAKVARVELSVVRGAAHEAPFVLLDALGLPVRHDLALASPFGRRKSAVLCFNLAHEAVGEAAPLCRRAPRLAAVLLARLVLVFFGRLDARADEALTAWGLQ